MSCYPSHRPMYCYIVWGDKRARYAGVLPTPVVVGPFKTKTQAQNAVKIDFGDSEFPDGIYVTVRQLTPFYTPADHLGSLHFDQMIDPKTVIRAPTKPRTSDKPVGSQDTAVREGGDSDDGLSDSSAERGTNPYGDRNTVHIVPG